MQSAVSEDRLATLLLEAGELERRVEVTRQVLVENKDFEPNLCFNTLTQFHWREYFDRNDLVQFLSFHGVDPHPYFLEILFNSLDKNRDGSVDWPEFLNTVMAKECGNPAYYANRNLLSAELEHSLFRVFQVELEGLADLDKLKEELYLFPTYSAASLFESLDRSKKGYLDAYDIQQFLDIYSPTMTFGKAERVLRRLDQDLDGRITFDEFLDFARPSAYPYNVFIERAGRSLAYSIRALSPRRYSPRRTSPYRETVIRSSPYRQTTVRTNHYGETIVRTTTSPLRNSLIRTSSPIRETVVRTTSPYRSSILRTSSPYRGTVLREEIVRASPTRALPAPVTGTLRGTMARTSPLRRSRSPGRYYSPTRHYSPYRRIYEPLVRLSPVKGYSYGATRAIPTSTITSNYARDTYNSSIRKSQNQFERSVRGGNSTISERDDDIVSQASFKTSSQLSNGPLNKLMTRTPATGHTRTGTYTSTYRTTPDLYSMSYHLTSLQRRELVQCLKDIFVGNRELERLKEDLCTRNDFNPTELFEMVASDNGVDLSLSEFQRLTSLTGASLLSQDAIFMFQTLDRNQDGYLTFEEFGEIFGAKKPEYRSQLQSRGRQDILRFDEYTLTTQNLIRDVILKGVQALNQAETSREIISQRLYTLFRILDKNNDGLISFNELAEVLNDQGLDGVTYRELVEVIEGFDFNRDGKITFREFIEELSPKKGFSSYSSYSYPITRFYYRV